MGDHGGFTVAEVLVAMALAAIVAAAAFVLLDAGVALGERGTEIGLSTVGLADTLVRLRADLARADDVRHAGPDSLHLRLPDGRQVAWAGRTVAGGLEVFRSVDEGSGLVPSPLRPVAELADGPSWPAGLDFHEEGDGRVRAHLRSHDRAVSIEAAPWRSP